MRWRLPISRFIRTAVLLWHGCLVALCGACVRAGVRQDAGAEAETVEADDGAKDARSMLSAVEAGLQCWMVSSRSHHFLLE